jgi:hypothetical protein
MEFKLDGNVVPHSWKSYPSAGMNDGGITLSVLPIPSSLMNQFEDGVAIMEFNNPGYIGVDYIETVIYAASTSGFVTVQNAKVDFFDMDGFYNLPARIVSSKSTYGYPNGAVLINDKIYVMSAQSSNPSQIEIFHSDPDNTARLATVDVAFDTNWENAMRMWTDGRFIYVVDYYDGLTLIDVTDDARPYVRQTVGREDSNRYYRDVAVTDSWVYVATTNGIELHNKDTLAYDSLLLTGHDVTRIRAENGYIYAARSGLFTILNQSDNAVVAEFSTSSDASYFDIVGDYLFLAHTSSNNIDVYDISDKSSVIHVVILQPLDDSSQNRPREIKVVGDYLLMSLANYYGIVDLDFGETESPSLTLSVPQDVVEGDVIKVTAQPDTPGNITVEFFLNGEPVGVTTQRPYTFYHPTTAQSAGEVYEYTARAINLSGVVGSLSAPVTTATVEDTQSPTISVTYPE